MFSWEATRRRKLEVETTESPWWIIERKRSGEGEGGLGGGVRELD